MYINYYSKYLNKKIQNGDQQITEETKCLTCRRGRAIILDTYVINIGEI